MRNLTAIMYTSVFILAYSLILYQQYAKDISVTKSSQLLSSSTATQQSDVTNSVPAISLRLPGLAHIRNSHGISEIKDNWINNTSSQKQGGYKTRRQQHDVYI